MSIHVMVAVWDCGPVDPHLRLALLALADNASKEGLAWPSIPTLARKCAVTPRTVIRTLHQLEAQGWITATRTQGRGNRYIINLEKMTHDAHVTGVVGVTSDAHVTGTSDAHVTGPVTPTSPELSMNRQLEPSQEHLLISDAETASSANAEGEFGRFWDAYPRKVGKRQARQAWSKARLRGQVVDIIDAARNLAKSGIDLQYVPYPTTWLNRDGWLDQSVVRTDGKAIPYWVQVLNDEKEANK